MMKMTFFFGVFFLVCCTTAFSAATHEMFRLALVNIPFCRLLMRGLAHLCCGLALFSVWLCAGCEPTAQHTPPAADTPAPAPVETPHAAMPQLHRAAAPTLRRSCLPLPLGRTCRQNLVDKTPQQGIPLNKMQRVSKTSDIPARLWQKPLNTLVAPPEPLRGERQ